MKKRRSQKISRVFLAAVFVLVLSLSGLTSAFAVDPSYGNEANPAQAAATKILSMPEGTVTPNATFTFQVQKVSIDGATTPAALATMPAVANKSVTYSAADTGVIVGGTKSVYKQTSDIFAGVTFPHAGLYEYTIHEVPSTYTIADATKESMSYTGGTYNLVVYVKDGVSGTYIYAVAAKVTVIDNPGQNVGDKVDPTPGTTTTTADFSKMTFTNVYTKTAGGVNPTDPNQRSLSIRKTVAGDYADKTLYFVFNVNMVKPTLISVPQTYKGYVVDSANAVVTSASNGTAMQTDSYGGYFNFTSGQAQNISLKHGQKLVFTAAYVGTTYTSIESAVADYTASALITVDGGTPIQLSNASDNTALSTGARILGQNANSADFTNSYKTITPTGLDINNVPFITLLVVGFGALVLFVVLKSRKKEEDTLA